MNYGYFIDPIDYVTKIGKSSHAPIVILPRYILVRFFAEFCAGFQLFLPKEYTEDSLE